MSIDVLCIGNVCYDIIAALENFPLENQKLEVHGFIESGGGPASNAAYLLSHWGVNCGISGLIGRDIYGQRIREEFEEAGMDTSLLEERAGHRTSVSFIFVNSKNGSRTVINSKTEGLPAKLDPENILKHKPSVLLMDGHELEASLAAMELFPEAITILDAGSLRKGTEILSKKVDYLAASERFALSITGLSSLDGNWQLATERLKKLNKKHIIITLGEKGLIYDIDGVCRHLPAYSVPAVDTTGAGDIFHGAFAYGVLNAMPIEENLKFSSMAAALSVMKEGGRTSIPSLPEVSKAQGSWEKKAGELY